MRLGEAIALTKRDVMTDSIIIRDSKTNKGRIVPIQPELSEKLLKQAKNERIFNSSQKGPVYVNEVSRQLRLRKQMLGIQKDCYAHVFRHSFITEMLEQGVPIQDVADIVGHSDIQTTRYYNTLNVDHLRKSLLFHPLIQEGVKFADIKKNVLEYIHKVSQKAKVELKISETKSLLSISIKNL